MENTTKKKATRQVKGALRIPPPMIHSLSVLTGALTHFLIWPLAIPGPPYMRRPLGLLLFIGAIAFTFHCKKLFNEKGETFTLDTPTNTLLTEGPFSWSRNPIYLGAAVIHFAASLLVGTFWIMITLPFAVFVMQKGVIEPEERYLAERFGQTYEDYKKQTRRWF